MEQVKSEGILHPLGGHNTNPKFFCLFYFIFKVALEEVKPRALSWRYPPLNTHDNA